MKEYYVTLENGYCAILTGTSEELVKMRINAQFTPMEKEYNGCRVVSVVEATDEHRDWVAGMGSGVSVVIDD